MAASLSFSFSVVVVFLSSLTSHTPSTFNLKPSLHDAHTSLLSAMQLLPVASVPSRHVQVGVTAPTLDTPICPVVEEPNKWADSVMCCTATLCISVALKPCKRSLAVFP